MFGFIYTIIALFSIGYEVHTESKATRESKQQAIANGWDHYYDHGSKCYRYIPTGEKCTFWFGDGRTSKNCLVNSKTLKVIKEYPTPRLNRALTREEFNAKLKELDKMAGIIKEEDDK